MAEKLKPLGSNVPPYLKSKGYNKQQAEQILRLANAMAVKRGTKIIHLDFVLVSDGTIRENQMGGTLVWQIRRAMQRSRGVGVPKGTGKAVVPQAGVRRRKPRKKAGQ